MLFGQAATVPAKQSNGTPPSAPSTPASYSAGPIAIVPIDSRDPGTAASVTGALEVTNGKAMIAAEGSVTSGSRTTEVTLPHRGVLRVCASTTVKLASDRSVPAGGDAPGLLMAIDRGALETSFATGRNADIVLTPDFRILIGGPGSSELKVRLGQQGDTCIDNTGADAPYVVVTSLFDTGLDRVQPGQRVMFQHGSLREVVDQEKEPCGCPPEPSKTGANEFPLAQSEGLAPTPAPAPTPAQPANLAPQVTAPLVYAPAPPQSTAEISAAQSAPAPTTATSAAAPSAAHPQKPGFFTRIGHFFKRIFGAD